MHPGHFHGRECRQFLFQKFGNERAILTIRNIAKKKKRFDDKVTITQTNVDDSQALFCTCRSHYHRN